MNNFKECWWDHVIVDVCGCNLAGILLGFYVIDKFKLERYRWSFRDAPLQTSAWHEFKYFCTHWDLSKLEMKSFKSLKKYLQLSWYCIFVIILIILVPIEWPNNILPKIHLSSSSIKLYGSSKSYYNWFTLCKCLERILSVFDQTLEQF